MKAICFYFQIHQPFRLKTYRFFDIGNDHYYYDDFANDEIITRIAHRSYLPANAMLLDHTQNFNFLSTIIIIIISQSSSYHSHSTA